MYAQLPIDDPRLQSTFEAVKRELWNTSPIGGVIRYPHDNYFLDKLQYKGNPWIVCTLWLAQYFNAAGEPDQAKELLAWALKRSLPSGSLSEQFEPTSSEAPLRGQSSRAYAGKAVRRRSL
jgi:GH15 family glucan-1,4-alpha-glucosidase